MMCVLVASDQALLLPPGAQETVGDEARSAQGRHTERGYARRMEGNYYCVHPT